MQSPETVQEATVKELAHRSNGGIEVSLKWDSKTGRLWVDVNNTVNHNEFTLDVPDNTKALDRFHHPFAYASYEQAHIGTSESDSD